MRACSILMAVLFTAACREPLGGGVNAQGGQEPVGGAGAPGEGGAGGAGGAPGAPATICNSGLSYTGLDLQCMSESCCDAANDCTVNGSDVEGCLECLIEGGERCQTLGECHNTVCAPPAGLCGTSLEELFAEPGVDACAEENCCKEISDCMDEPEGCAACIADGGGPLCDSMLACVSDNCLGSGNNGICDSGLTTADDVADQCLSDSCCEEFFICTDGGADVESCVTCFNEGGGPLCDDAVACADASGCIEI